MGKHECQVDTDTETGAPGNASVMCVALVVLRRDLRAIASSRQSTIRQTYRVGARQQSSVIPAPTRSDQVRSGGVCPACNRNEYPAFLHHDDTLERHSMNLSDRSLHKVSGRHIDMATHQCRRRACTRSREEKAVEPQAAHRARGSTGRRTCRSLEHSHYLHIGH